MPSVGDIIRITSCSNLLGQQACNVFYYLVAAWTGNLTLQDALEVWNDLVPETIAGQLSSGLTVGTVEWSNTENSAEQASIQGGFRGALAGELIASFASVSIRMFVDSGVTRTGWKRLPGINESLVANGTLVGGAVTAFQTWANDSLAAPVEAAVAADMTLIPVVVGRNPDGTLNLAAVNPISSAVVQPLLTTQNTRKVGRGS